MNKLARIVRPVGIILAVIGVLLVLGFVEKAANGALVKDVQVHMKGDAGIHFIDEGTLIAEIMDQGPAILGMPVAELDIPGIENRLRMLPAVARAEVYHTMDGTLHVKAEQRVPIARVINADGSSFYIDQDGWTMPLSDAYTARVLVVTGSLHEPGARDGVLDVLGSDSLRSHFLSDDIHRLAGFIRQEPLWDALIDQVVVNSDGHFELVPKVGAQRILIGDGTMLDQRFAKLELFYRKGIHQADWRRYDRIDLRFTDQIVCTKRTTP